MRLHIIILSVLLTSLTANADFKSWQVDAVQGTVKASENLILEKAEAAMYCKYCNTGSCAAGPEHATFLDTALTERGSGTYEISIKAGSHSSGHLFKSLSRCGYVLHLEGRDASNGTHVTGFIDLVTSSKNSPNPIWDRENLDSELSAIISSLKLEIRKLGFSAPAIYPTK